jgi:hypothetical protein
VCVRFNFSDEKREDRYASQCEMSLFFFNWCVFSALQVTLLIQRPVFARNAANCPESGANFFWLVVSEVRLTTLTGLAELEAFATATQIGLTCAQTYLAPRRRNRD